MCNSYDKRFKNISKNIKRFREEKNITQAELADRVGISLSYLSKIEAANSNKSFSLHVLFDIADALGVEVSKFFDWKIGGDFMANIVTMLGMSGNRKEIRKNVILKFMDEEPGTGRGENCSRYIYVVEELEDGSNIYLKRPAPLNKGVDFEVHVENTRFRSRGARLSMPSHNNIIEDLSNKKNSNAEEHRKVKDIINRW